MPRSKKDGMTFEEAFQKLESIVASMESGESTLDQVLEEYQEGMRMVQFCTKKLDEAETRLKRLIQGEDGQFRLEPME